MVSAFFYCNTLGMNMEKFFDKLITREEIQDVPIESICKVVVCVFEIINSGECFYETEID